jgi:hypothetical protein
VEAVLGVWRPNPFADETRLALDLAGAGRIDLTLYALDGRPVRTLRAESADPDSQVVAWDGRDGAGRPAPSGVYFARLKSGGIELPSLVLVR